jgi:hypothetical protein
MDTVGSGYIASSQTEENTPLLAVVSSRCESYVTTDSQSASLSWTKVPIWGLTTRFLLLSDSCGFVDVGRSLWREGGSVVYHSCWLSPAQSFSGPSPLGLATIFYGLRFETSLFVASYDSRGYGGGIRPRLHAGFLAVALLWCVVAVATDCIGNTASNSSSIVACLSVAAVTWRLLAIA